MADLGTGGDVSSQCAGRSIWRSCERGQAGRRGARYPDQRAEEMARCAHPSPAVVGKRAECVPDANEVHLVLQARS